MESRTIKKIQILGILICLLVTIAITSGLITSFYLVWYLIPVILAVFDPKNMNSKRSNGYWIQTFGFVGLGMGIAKAMPEGVVTDDIIDALLKSTLFVTSLFILGFYEIFRRFNNIMNT